MKKLSLTLTLCLATALYSCSATSDSMHQDGQPPVVSEKLEPYECGDIARLHTYDSIFLASQPKPADFEQVAKSGVKTVINIRHDSEITDFDEKEVVTGHGLNYVHLPWNGVDELTDEVFAQTRELLNTAERPILLHCGSANRVGGVWIPWRVLDGGLSFEEALAEAEVVGLKNAGYIDRAREYIASQG